MYVVGDGERIVEDVRVDQLERESVRVARGGSPGESDRSAGVDIGGSVDREGTDEREEGDKGAVDAFWSETSVRRPRASRGCTPELEEHRYWS